MRRAHVPVLLFVLLASRIHSADQVQVLLADAVQRLSPGGSGPMVVSVGNFTYADTKVGSSFSRYCQEQLSTVLGRDARFELFARDRLEEVLQAAELSLSDLFDPATAVRVGRLKAVRGIFFGRFFDQGSGVRLFLELVDIQSGITAGRTEVLVRKSAIPAPVSVLPANYSDALSVIDELAQVQNAGDRDLSIRAWTPRGEGGVYRAGEQLVVHFFANRDCFIKVYHIAVDRSLQLIYPNRFCPQNRVEGGKLYSIPDSSYPFTFDLAAPYGAEFIKVVASTVQFSEIEESFSPIGSVSREMVGRGLNVAARTGQTAEALISYTIVE